MKRQSKSVRNLKKATTSRGNVKVTPIKGLDGQIMQQGVAQLPPGYVDLIRDVKQRLKAAQTRAALAVNRELVELYWEIGGLIVQRQAGGTWGAAVIEQLAKDLRAAFPELSGLSRTNLFRVRSLYLVYSKGLGIVPQAVGQIDDTKIPQAVGQLQPRKVTKPARKLRASKRVAQPVRQLPLAQIPDEIASIPWGHNIALLEKLDDNPTRLWYARQTALHGWSRSVLVMQIETEAHKRQGTAITNFDRTLPPPQSDLARQLLKDPYTFEFLTIADDAHERELERSLIEHIKQFLLELGAGFAFVGSQYRLEVGGDEFFVDLLFYHLRLRCLIAIDLKMEAFQPEHAGKMNFYLAALDAQVRHADDGRSIGLILCKDKNRVIVEYALQDMGAPLGVASFRLLPAVFQANLPSPELLASEVHKYEQLTRSNTDD